MNLCSHNHEEICFESRSCPLCAEIESKEELENELNRKIVDLENTIDDLKTQ